MTQTTFYTAGQTYEDIGFSGPGTITLQNTKGHLIRVVVTTAASVSTDTEAYIELSPQGKKESQNSLEMYISNASDKVYLYSPDATSVKVRAIIS